MRVIYFYPFPTHSGIDYHLGRSCRKSDHRPILCYRSILHYWSILCYIDSEVCFSFPLVVWWIILFFHTSCHSGTPVSREELRVARVYFSLLIWTIHAWGLKTLHFHLSKFESTQSIATELDPTGDLTQQRNFNHANPHLDSLGRLAASAVAQGASFICCFMLNADGIFGVPHSFSQAWPSGVPRTSQLREDPPLYFIDSLLVSNEMNTDLFWSPKFNASTAEMEKLGSFFGPFAHWGLIYKRKLFASTAVPIFTKTLGEYYGTDSKVSLARAERDDG